MANMQTSGGNPLLAATNLPVTGDITLNQLTAPAAPASVVTSGAAVSECTGVGIQPIERRMAADSG